MIVSLKITKQQRNALLLFYPSVKFFLQKCLLNKATQIIEEQQIFDYEKELDEYHQRRALNEGVKWEPGMPFWKNRKHTQATKDKIRLTLLEKYRGKHFTLLKETKELIGLGNEGKVVSQETRDLMSKANLGKKRTDRQKANISRGHIGLHYNKEKRF